MAQVLRTPAVSSPTTVAASRPAANAAARGVATVDGTAIEELNASVSVYYGEGGLPFQEEGYFLGEHQQDLQRHDQPLVLNLGGIKADSADFAAFFENYQGGGVGSGFAAGDDGPSPDVLLTAAIDRYETNAKIIAGDIEKRGESINLSL